MPSPYNCKRCSSGFPPCILKKLSIEILFLGSIGVPEILQSPGFLIDLSIQNKKKSKVLNLSKCQLSTAVKCPIPIVGDLSILTWGYLSSVNCRASEI